MATKIKATPDHTWMIRKELAIPVTLTPTQITALTDSTTGLIKDGTIFPTNTSSAIGIIVNDYDPESAVDKTVSVMTKGAVGKNELPVAPVGAAITAMKGIQFIDGDTVA